jgi:hypothetical protein
MTGARGIMAGIGIGIGTETVIARGTEIDIGEMIVGGMIETAIETVIGTGREKEIGIGIDVGMNLLLAAAHLHLIDIVKPRIHLGTTALPLEGHLPQRLKRRNRG